MCKEPATVRVRSKYAPPFMQNGTESFSWWYKNALGRVYLELEEEAVSALPLIFHFFNLFSKAL